MKAHCRIKKSAELTARAGATVCLLDCLPACLPGVTRISSLYRMPSGLNELNYTSLRVIRGVDDRDTDEVRIRTTGVSQKFELLSALSMSLSLSRSASLFSTRRTHPN